MQRTTHRTYYFFALAMILLVGVGSTQWAQAGSAEAAGPNRVEATADGLELDGSPWWPSGFNAYQLRPLNSSSSQAPSPPVKTGTTIWS